MTTVAIAVVAHPKRSAQAARLADALGAHVVMDDGEYGDAINHARAWEWLAEQGAEWALAVEDDAVPVSGLRSILEGHALPNVPSTGLVTLYTGTDSRAEVQAATLAGHHKAASQGRSWIKMPALFWGVAIAAPTTLAADLARYLRRSPDRMSDSLVSRRARRLQLPIYATSPNLVDHDDIESVLGHGKRWPRRAHRVAAPEVWTQEYVNY